jgi:hypothetical protein
MGVIGKCVDIKISRGSSCVSDEREYIMWNIYIGVVVGRTLACPNTVLALAFFLKAAW